MLIAFARLEKSGEGVFWFVQIAKSPGHSEMCLGVDIASVLLFVSFMFCLKTLHHLRQHQEFVDVRDFFVGEHLDHRFGVAKMHSSN